VSPAAGAPKASLFVTCVVDQFYPEIGASTVRVLEHLGVDIDFPKGQTCCGQPAFNSGFWSEAVPLARRFLNAFEGDRHIVAPSGSCVSMVSVFYEELLHDEPELLERARAIAPRVYELSEYVVDVLGVTDISVYRRGSDEAPAVNATYHEACHLRRELGVLTQPRSIMEQLPGVSLTEMEQAEVCCGFGGTFSIKYPDISGAMLEDKLRYVAGSGAGTLVACDATCLMQIVGGLERQGSPVRPLHLAQLMDEQLGLPG
jgi:L-lactate dehydrogenase complex protein LldE